MSKYPGPQPKNPISHFTFEEVIKATTVPTPGTELSIHVPLSMIERRIYLYLEVALATSAAYHFGGTVRTYADNSLVGAFPASIADFTGLSPNQSIASLFNAGGSPVGDSLVIRLAQPFSTTTQAVIQPVRLNAEIDKVSFQVTSVFGTSLAGWRAYLACLSAKV